MWEWCFMLTSTSTLLHRWVCIHTDNTLSDTTLTSMSHSTVSGLRWRLISCYHIFTAGTLCCVVERCVGAGEWDDVLVHCAVLLRGVWVPVGETTCWYTVLCCWEVCRCRWVRRRAGTLCCVVERCVGTGEWDDVLVHCAVLLTEDEEKNSHDSYHVHYPLLIQVPVLVEYSLLVSVTSSYAV